MINSNLFFLRTFLAKLDRRIQFSETVRSICPAEELGQQYSRATGEAHSNLDIYFRINPKVIKELTAKEKVRLYEIVRLIALYTDDPWWRYIYQDYNDLLQKRSFKDPRYLYLRTLKDSMFCYEIDCRLDKHSSQRRQNIEYYLSDFTENCLTLKATILKYLQTRVLIVVPRKPKRLIRHKGYRDHGSLGTGIPGLESDIKSDVWIQERAAKEKKKARDFIKFCLGLQGWE